MIFSSNEKRTELGVKAVAYNEITLENHLSPEYSNCNDELFTILVVSNRSQFSFVEFRDMILRYAIKKIGRFLNGKLLNHIRTLPFII